MVTSVLCIGLTPSVPCLKLSPGGEESFKNFKRLD